MDNLPRIGDGVLRLDVQIFELIGGLRHVFDFEYDGQRCHCFALSLGSITQELKAGDHVRLVGEWSAALQGVLNVYSLEPI